MPICETWTYGICEYCRKNMHKEVKMKREKVVGYNNESKKLWICPVCGSSKAL